MKRILLLDDEAAIRMLMAEYLEMSGYSVVHGGEGLEAVRRESFDVVITDLFMPEKEGLETIRDLRRLRPELKIIAMSGGSRDYFRDYLDLARRLGASRPPAKPFGMDQLAAAIAAVLG